MLLLSVSLFNDTVNSNISATFALSGKLIVVVVSNLVITKSTVVLAGLYVLFPVYVTGYVPLVMDVFVMYIVARPSSIVPV